MLFQNGWSGNQAVHKTGGIDFGDEKLVGFQRTTGGLQAKDHSPGNRAFNTGKCFPAGRIRFKGRDSWIGRLRRRITTRLVHTPFQVSHATPNVAIAYRGDLARLFPPGARQKAAGKLKKCTRAYNTRLMHARSCTQACKTASPNPCSGRPHSGRHCLNPRSRI